MMCLSLLLSDPTPCRIQTRFKEKTMMIRKVLWAVATFRLTAFSEYVCVVKIRHAGMNKLDDSKVV